jgi:hypothetical protein
LAELREAGIRVRKVLLVLGEGILRLVKGT